jgi:SpoVK/Ycf46/Vps4 family AAA+-type ATPase
MSPVDPSPEQGTSEPAGRGEPVGQDSRLRKASSRPSTETDSSHKSEGAPELAQAARRAASSHTHAEQIGIPGLFDHLRETGERITGGGMRALCKRLFLNAVREISRAVRRRPRLLAAGQRLLRPFPDIASRLTKLTLVADPFSGQTYIPSGRLSRYSDATALTLSLSARIIYLRLRAEASDAGSWTKDG